MLVKHIRDADNKPFATLVATDRDHLGLAICCPRDQYNKKLGIKIAESRANKNIMPNVPMRHKTWNYVDNVGDMDILGIITQEVRHMVVRARKYFK